MRIGSSAAKEWTDAHEIKASGIDKTMDLFNNGVGRVRCKILGYDNIGNPHGLAVLDLSNLIYDSVANGEALMIVNNTLVPTYI